MINKIRVSKYVVMFSLLLLGLPLWGAQPPGAVVENLTFNGQVDQDQANFILRGRLKGSATEEQELKLIYSLNEKANIQVSQKAVAQISEFNARIHQGKMKELVLAMRGEGEVTEVTGPNLKDWSVRRGMQGGRFLVMRPQEPATNVVQTNFIVTVKSKQTYDTLPRLLAPLSYFPENAVLYDGIVEVNRAETLELGITNVAGLMPVQAQMPGTAAPKPAPGKKDEPLRFRFSGTEYALVMEIREKDPDAHKVAWENFKLTGEFKEHRASFTLTGEAVVKHPEGGALAILAGEAALTEYSTNAECSFDQGRYWLRFRNPGTFPIEIKFDARMVSQDGWKGVNFEVAPSALRPLILKGLSADTQFQLSNAAKPESRGEEFAGFLPSTGKVQLQWKEAKAEEFGKLFYSAEAVAQVAVGPGLMRQAYQVEFKVMQGEMNQLAFELTGEGEITRIRGEDILAWKIEGPLADKKRRLIVQLNQAYKDRYRLLIQTQTPLGVFPLQVLPLRLAPAQAIRYGGHLLVVNDGAVRLEVTEARGLSQISPELFPQNKELAELAAAQRSQSFAYRFSGGDFSLGIQADHILPELSASQMLVYHVGETELAIDSDIELDIREAALREFNVRIPSDFTVTRVSMEPLSDQVISPDTVAGWSRLKLVFPIPLTNHQVIQLRLEKNLVPTNGAWTLPVVQPQNVKTLRGYVGVAAETGFRVTPTGLTNLSERTSAAFPKRVPGLQLVYYFQDETWQAVLNIQRLALSIQAEAVHLFTISEGIAYGSSVLNFLISGTPVSILKLAVPPDYANIEFAGRDVRNWKKTDAGYEVYLQTPVFGTYTLLATFDRQFNAKNNTLSFTGIRPLEVQSEQGSILVVSEYPIEVNPAEMSPGLIQLDPVEIPAEYRLLFDLPILAAYQYAARPFSLRLTLNTLTQGESIHQVVDRASLNTHISREGEAVTEARYFIKSKGLSHLRLQMPAETRLWEAKVNGNKVVPVADGQATLFPLPLKAEAGSLLTVDLKLAAKSTDKKWVKAAMPALAVPVLLTEWQVTPDETYRLQFRQGSVAPNLAQLDRTGFAWLEKLFKGDYGTSWQRSAFSAMALLLLSALALRWATKTGACRWSFTHWAGTGLGLLACGAAFYYLATLMTFAASQAIPDEPGLTFIAPVQEAGTSLAIQMKNIAVEKYGFSLWTAWPALAGLILWFYLMVRATPGTGQKAGWMMGWMLIGWAALRVPNGTPVFLGVVMAYVIVHVLVPAGRCQWRLPRRVKPTADTAAGAAAGAALLLIAFISATSVAAASSAANSEALAATEKAPSDKATNSLVSSGGKESLKSIVLSAAQSGRVQEGFVLIDARLKWKTEAGQHLDFLRAPAVLTKVDYPPTKLQLTESQTEGQPVYRLTANSAGEFSLQFCYELALLKDSAGTSFILPTPFGLVNRLDLEVERAEVDIFSASAISITTQRSKRGEMDVTRAELVLAPVMRPSIGWRPRARDARLEKAVYYAELYHLYLPTAGVVEGVHDIQVRPAQGQLTELNCQIPSPLTITDVQADFVSSWRFDPDQQVLRIQFNTPQARPFAVRLRSQLATGPLPYAHTNAVLTVQQAAGQVGMMGVATSGEVQLDNYKEQGLSAINLEDFPTNLIEDGRRQNPDFALRRAYRYSEATARLVVAAAAVQPEVRVETQETLSLGEDATVLAAQWQVHITRSGIFKLSFPLPRDFGIESLSGAALSHWTEIKTATERIITLNLRGKTQGDQAFSISLAGPGIGGRKEWTAPRLVLREANKQSGQLVIVPELGMRLHVKTREGVTQLDPQKAGVQQKGVTAYRLLNTGWQLGFDVETVEPWIQAASLQDVTIREGQAMVNGYLDYQIENAGIKALQVQIPARAESVHFEGDLITDTIRSDSGTNRLADWEIKLQRRVIGNYGLRVTYQLSSTNRAAEWRIAGIKAKNANLQRGYVAVRASGRLQIAFPQLPPALQRAEWQTIPSSLRRGRELAETKDTFSSLETDFELPVSLSLHEAAKVLPARVEKVELTSVVAPSGEMLTEGRLWLQPGDKRLLHLKVPRAGHFWYAFVNGENAWPWREGDQILLLLEKNSDPDKSTTVEFFYTCQAGMLPAHQFTHQLLGPGFDLPLENITWRVFVPESWKIKAWESTLQLRSETQAAAPAMITLDTYLEAEAERLKEKSKEAESLLLMGNEFLQKGAPQEARRAYQAAWKLSQNDAAFNEDARVQLHNLKMQQALLGLNQRRQAAFERADGRVSQAIRSPFARWAPGQAPAYTQQQAQQALDQNAADDNAALMRLAERLIRQQDASVGKPEAIRAALPTQGKLLTFTGSLQVDSWSDLQVKLQARPQSPGHWQFHLLILALVFFGLALLSVFTRRPIKSG